MLEGRGSEAAAELPIEGELPDVGGATAWLNSEPLAAAGLRGKVVLVQFCTYSCVNWLRTLPYVRAWVQRYRDDGLVVIGAHAPEFAFEHDIEKVRSALDAMGVDYPIAIDNDFAIWRAFGNRYWPALYVADAQGRRRDHFGEGRYEGSERRRGQRHDRRPAALPARPSARTRLRPTFEITFLDSGFRPTCSRSASHGDRRLPTLR